MQKPVVFVAVGLPGCGKSTFFSKWSNIHILGTDMFVERLCMQNGVSYNEGFSTYIKAATTAFNDKIDTLIAQEVSFVWDQTNLSNKKRSKILRRVPKHWTKICYNFNVPIDVCLSRNAARDRAIPAGVITDMHENRDSVYMDEGWDLVIDVVD